MEKIHVELANCYGIQEFDYEFDFSESNVIAIYARNGLMKTSFSKAFKKIQTKKPEEIRDEIFDLDGSADITVDEREILADEIFVIRSFENSYESGNITSLLVKDSVKEKIKSVLRLKDSFLKSMEKYSGLKVVKTSLGKKIYEMEPTVVKDFQFDEDSFLLNIKKLSEKALEYECSGVVYSSIFDEAVMKKIKSNKFQEKIDDFIQKSDEIYSEYVFLEKGRFTLPKIKDIEKTLDKDKFFVKNNHLYLEGGYEIKGLKDLKSKISEIEGRIKMDPVFQDIEKMLSDIKGSVLKETIENNPDLVPYLKLDRVQELKKCMWLSYINAEKEKFDELLRVYNELENEIEDVDLDDTPWKKALNIFEDRFTVPYKMKISNMKGAVIGESIPRVEFSFERDGQVVEMNRTRLENIDVLSQGEKRALYLLNVIFDIEQRKYSNKETLFIIDDIADSFDYKNKYAIIEYLYEMTQNEKFYLIILSHNFDFYRTVSSRFGIKRKNRLCAEPNDSKIVLRQEKYQGQPFDYWKQNLGIHSILALIPFARNIVEYGKDKNIGNIVGIDEDYLLLTDLLHEKEKTNDITFDILKAIYIEYLGITDFKDEIALTSPVIEKIYDVADTITNINVNLEYKIILAMAIRHKAEKFMISKIHNYTNVLTWKKKKQIISGTVAEFMAYLSTARNQTRELFGAYKQFGQVEKIKVLEEVNIMTPENIHLNSFMYEPILDMDIVELIRLYQDVKNL